MVLYFQFKGADFSYGSGKTLAEAEKPTEQNAKPEEDEHVGTFEDLLNLDPKQVVSITVRPPGSA
jgi:hypothetical protein